MAELSPLDAELLAQDLPELAQVAVASSIYPGQRGQVEYRAAGDASNAAVLMLHGLGSSSAGYRAQFAGLSRDFHVIAWNAPGFGGSSPISGHNAGIDDYAEALEAFLRALRVERVSALVGSSWGSVVALAFTRRYPALVGSLVLSAIFRWFRFIQWLAVQLLPDNLFKVGACDLGHVPAGLFLCHDMIVSDPSGGS